MHSTKSNTAAVRTIHSATVRGSGVYLYARCCISIGRRQIGHSVNFAAQSSQQCMWPHGMNTMSRSPTKHTAHVSLAANCSPLSVPPAAVAAAAVSRSTEAAAAAAATAVAVPIPTPPPPQPVVRLGDGTSGGGTGGLFHRSWAVSSRRCTCPTSFAVLAGS